MESQPTLSEEQRRYVFIKQGLYPGILNFVMNGAIAWLAVRGMERVPLFGSLSSIAVDTLATCFLLPFITCLIVTPTVRSAVKSGVIQPVALPPWLMPFRHIFWFAPSRLASGCGSRLGVTFDRCIHWDCRYPDDTIRLDESRIC